MIPYMSDVISGGLGWCPKSPVLQTATALIAISLVTVQGDRAGSNGPAVRSVRLRQGISIAAASLMAIMWNRH